jgi:hypothetical protein
LKNKQTHDYLDITITLSFFSAYELQKKELCLKSHRQSRKPHQGNRKQKVMALVYRWIVLDNHKLLNKKLQQLKKLPLPITAYSFCPYDNTSFFRVLTFLEVLFTNQKA